MHQRTPSSRDALVTAAQFIIGLDDLTVEAIKRWRRIGWYGPNEHGQIVHHKLEPQGRERIGRRCQPPYLYRYGDLLKAERDTRNNGRSKRSPHRTVLAHA